MECGHKFVAVHMAVNRRITCAGGPAFGIVNGDLHELGSLRCCRRGWDVRIIDKRGQMTLAEVRQH